MTTKVVIACPDNSVHDAAIFVEHKHGESWIRTGGPAAVVAPRETASPIYLTLTSRVVIEEMPRGADAAAEPKA